MTEHTPTPWRVERCGELAPNDKMLYATLGFHDNGIEIIRTVGRVFSNGGAEEAEANAAFIVKAVNNHDALTADLAEAVRLLDALLGLEKGSGEAALAFVERYNAAVGISQEDRQSSLVEPHRGSSDVLKTASD